MSHPSPHPTLTKTVSISIILRASPAPLAQSCVPHARSPLVCGMVRDKREPKNQVEDYVDVEVAMGCCPRWRAQFSLGKLAFMLLCSSPCILTHFPQDLHPSHRILLTSTISLCGAGRIAIRSPLLLTPGCRIVCIKYVLSNFSWCPSKAAQS